MSKSMFPFTTLAVFFALSSPAASQEDNPLAVQFTSQGRTVHALLWGQGPYGVILSHGAIYDAASCPPLAVDIARYNITALALEETDPDAILSAHAYLSEQRGVKAVALIGASTGGSTALSAMAHSPKLWEQLILLSGSGDVSRIGSAPKLFVASEGEGMTDTARRMAADAPGKQNDVLILKGSAHAQAISRTSQGPRLTKAILERLDAGAKKFR